jgi:hypothetical protein
MQLCSLCVDLGGRRIVKKKIHGMFALLTDEEGTIYMNIC